MNLRSLDLNLLTVFDALMQEQHLSRAAANLNMSQPAVSNALARMRVQFKDPLFVRTAQGMLPTAKAEQLYPPVRQALEGIKSAFDAKLGFEPVSAQRQFRLSMNDYGEQIFMPELMPQIRAQAPHLSFSIELETGEVLRHRLQQGTLDLAFDYITINDGDFVHEQVGTEALAVVSSLDNPWITDGLSLQDYLKAPHLTLKNRDRIGTPLEIVLGKKRLNRRTVLEVPHMLAMPAIVSSTDLVCTIPKRLARAQSRLWPLKIVDLPFYIPDIPVYMIWHKSYAEDLGHRWLRNQVKAFFGVAE